MERTEARVKRRKTVEEGHEDNPEVSTGELHEHFNFNSSYYSMQHVKTGLKSGSLVEGEIKFSQVGKGYVSDPIFKLDIFVDNNDRNSAFQNDTVVVEIYPKYFWKVQAAILKKLFKEKGVISGEEFRIITKDVVHQRKEGIITKLLEEPGSYEFIQRTAKVVQITERAHSGNIVGQLEGSEHVDFIFLRPSDYSFPLVKIPVTDPLCPKDFYTKAHKYENKLYASKILYWESKCACAVGTLKAMLGNKGDINVETDRILIERDISFKKFSKDVLSCLPTDWKIPISELNIRRDLREECIFTIDPSTSKDLDDGLSCTLLPNLNYQVGVHIADVSFFIKEGTPLDDIAFQRSTSVYLLQKMVPMIPEKLSNEICSLNPGQDKLSFSVIWQISPDGEICHEWIGRCVIRSCAKFNYDQAQAIIENSIEECDKLDLPQIFGNYEKREISIKIKQLHKIAVILREKRHREGSLVLNQEKVQVVLSESNNPMCLSINHPKDSNYLVEEYMLLANTSVAQKCKFRYPQLLRRQPPPQPEEMEKVISLLGKKNIMIDGSNSKSLHTSLEIFKENGPLYKGLVSVLCKIMKPASYFFDSEINSKKFSDHYALHVPVYTHFTSPIRRYPDILVHRLLGAALGYNTKPCINVSDMDRFENHFNLKKHNAKLASKQSQHLFLTSFIRDLGSVPSEVIVVNLEEQHLDYIILGMGIAMRALYCKLPLKKWKVTNSNEVIHVKFFWSDASETAVIQNVELFSILKVVVIVENMKIKVNFLKPDN